jgi:hypothetical protein
MWMTKHHRSAAFTDTGCSLAAIAKFLKKKNLLREIIVCVGFPTTLVRASLVYKCWLVHTSDHNF